MLIVSDILQILRLARQNALRSINSSMLQAYWLVGKRIVEEEQMGKSRAMYGKAIIKNLSEELQREFGKGFSVRNIEQMRLFYTEYSKSQTVSAEFNNQIEPKEIPPQISEKPKPQTVSAVLQAPDSQLSWSHYQVLLRIDDKNERNFYEIEAAKNQWSLRELKRQFDSALYLRLALSKDKEGIKNLSTQRHIIETSKDLIKSPVYLRTFGTARFIVSYYF